MGKATVSVKVEQAVGSLLNLDVVRVGMTKGDLIESLIKDHVISLMEEKLGKIELVVDALCDAYMKHLIDTGAITQVVKSAMVEAGHLTSYTKDMDIRTELNRCNLATFNVVVEAIRQCLERSLISELHMRALKILGDETLTLEGTAKLFSKYFEGLEAKAIIWTKVIGHTFNASIAYHLTNADDDGNGVTQERYQETISELEPHSLMSLWLATLDYLIAEELGGRIVDKLTSSLAVNRALHNSTFAVLNNHFLEELEAYALKS